MKKSISACAFHSDSTAANEFWKDLFQIRPLENAEKGKALQLAWRVFCEFESPDYAPEGTEEFKRCLNDDTYLAGIRYYGAFDEEKLVGMLGIREEKCHVCFFFVDGEYQRLGIGRKLFQRMREDFPGRTITLNSSPYGLPFYKAIGFTATDRELTVNGIRFTPMEYNEKEPMKKEIEPKDTTRAAAYALWMKAPNPMVTFFKTLDVTNLVKVSKRTQLKFHMLLNYCIGTAAAPIKEFYILPVGDKLIQYDAIAVNTIVKNKNNEVSSCDIRQSADLIAFNQEYLKYTAQVAESCTDRDLSEEHMVIGTSAIIDTEIDGAVGMNSGVFNNPFLIWGKYRKKFLRYDLPISFQFHHTQMDGAHAGRFLENLQSEINNLRR